MNNIFIAIDNNREIVQSLTSLMCIMQHVRQWPDDISCVLMLHGSVDDGYQGYVGHIADIIVDQELEVGNVDDSNVPMVIMY